MIQLTEEEIREIIQRAWELGNDYGGISLPEAKEEQEKHIQETLKKFKSLNFQDRKRMVESNIYSFKKTYNMK